MLRRTTALPVAITRIAACMLLTAIATVAQAASVRSVGINDLTSKSAFVFQGVAVEKWVAAGSRPGAIVTNMRFKVLDVLKGDRKTHTVVLSFLGGTLNGRTLRVEGMELPQIGDEGIFFVERLGGNLVQPFYGWDQGRFHVKTDTQGRKYVATNDQQPVRRVDAVGGKGGVASGHAAGIVTSDSERDALSVDAFKSRIRAILETQQ